MQESKRITISCKRKEVTIEVRKILYILMKRNSAEIHVAGGKVYSTRRTYGELTKELDDSFIEVRRGCVVSALAIYRFRKKLELINGECICYTVRKKKELIEKVREKQRSLIDRICADGAPVTEEEYRSYYSGFDNMPFAFTDIEIVFNSESHAVDWIFRYGNQALARLEKTPLEKLIGNSFGNLFSNMDSKWLQNYERSAIFGETLEIIDYSPEIDTYLKIISFPTFKGHCGCILFDVSEIELTQKSTPSAMRYYGTPSENDG